MKYAARTKHSDRVKIRGYVTKGIKRRLKALAEKEGLSVSATLEHILDTALPNKRERKSVLEHQARLICEKRRFVKLYTYYSTDVDGKYPEIETTPEQWNDMMDETIARYSKELLRESWRNMFGKLEMPDILKGD